MDENIKKADFKRLLLTSENLKKNGFQCYLCDNITDAKKKIIELIGKEKKVAMGGCMTARDMGLVDEISKNNIFYTHKPDMTPQQRREIWLLSMDSDFYIASPQAVTIDGKLLFIDGTGNRCAALTWGPKHIIFIAGSNKIVKDQEEAFYRARNLAAIRNNIRLMKKNPCVEKGICVDCSSPERICNIVTILWKRPKITDISVFLVNENLGY